MNDTGNITKYSEEDIDQEVGVTASFEEDTKRWNEDGKDDLADVTTSETQSAQISSCKKCNVE